MLYDVSAFRTLLPISFDVRGLLLSDFRIAVGFAFQNTNCHRLRVVFQNNFHSFCSLCRLAFRTFTFHLPLCNTSSTHRSARRKEQTHSQTLSSCRAVYGSLRFSHLHCRVSCQPDCFAQLGKTFCSIITRTGTHTQGGKGLHSNIDTHAHTHTHCGKQ